MLTEVYPQIYLNEIPLPKFSLQAVNSYLILSDQRNLMIDTGFNTDLGRDAMLQSIQELKVDLNKTDVILTHMHPDHVGLASYLQEKGAKVYISLVDGELINSVYTQKNKSPLQELYEVLTEDKDIEAVRGHAFGDNSTEAIQFHYLIEGDKFFVGDYEFEVVSIPGHTPGHIGLYERKHRLFFGGDHILEHISPSVVFWGFDQDILNQYINSLKKVYELDVDYLFTAHLNIIRDHRRRIEELIAHCEERLVETENLLNQGKLTPKETAAQMHWSLRTKWEDFSKLEKFSAIGETLAFLEHLTQHEKIVRHSIAGKIFYDLNII
ncbi:MBL fold metallo-hydrolase [Desulfitobacterium metallireducens]|uniref:Zn-dependent hydrolase n=1 Tax=Desulfitobacterium metallireducens DSM 15288 TaxID=871968 RepID=W0ECT5_9FIRM|nr:MBL fold metallo-hydrolase [Desulfitobacterium metallireducens]AHF07333.1 Zn-dependent hydrolase [Desulfitobacterium metallireducens DSM 15288]